MPQFTFRIDPNTNMLTSNLFTTEGSSFDANTLSSLNLFSNQSFNQSFNFGVPSYNFNFSNASIFGNSYNFNQTQQQQNYTFNQSRTVQLSGNRVSDALSLAESQIGVREFDGTNNGTNVNKYRFGKSDGTPWCASFISWCYGQGQQTSNKTTFGYDASTQSIRQKAEKAGFYAKKEDNYKPKVGDLAMWKYSSTTGHIGIISKVNNDGTFEVIEGNCGNQVRKVRRSENSEGFHGYVKMNEWLSA